MNRIVKSSRIRFALWHLLISGMIAMAVALLVFALWYPYPFNRITGGMYLFFTVVGVDLVCGPLFTLIMANPKKPRRELVFDLTLVVLIQLGALGYGLYSVKLARPVVLAFEHDRIHVVTEAEVDEENLDKAPEGLRALPLGGMLKVGVRRAKNEKEFFESIHLSTSEGIEPSVRPDWWVPFNESLAEIKEKRKPVAELKKQKMSDEQASRRLADAVDDTKLPLQDLYYLPLTSKYTQSWIVLLDKKADFVGYAEVDGFDAPKEQKK